MNSAIQALQKSLGPNAGAVRALMGSLTQSRRFALSGQGLARIRAAFTAGRADEDEVAATIRTVKRETGNFVDPHTAVGIAVAEKEPRDPTVPMVVLATAHPAKFPDAVEKATGVRPPLPPRLADLMTRTERVDGLPNDVAALKQLIDDRMEAVEPRSRAARP